MGTPGFRRTGFQSQEIGQSEAQQRSPDLQQVPARESVDWWHGQDS